MSTKRLEIRFPSDEAWCRVEARDFAADLGFGRPEAAAVAIVVSELASNALKFAGGGVILLRRLASPPGIEIEIDDDGPGLGRGTAPEAVTVPAGRRSLGVGLGAVQRLTDWMQIEVRPGRGTTVTVRKWLAGGSRHIT